MDTLEQVVELVINKAVRGQVINHHGTPMIMVTKQSFDRLRSAYDKLKFINNSEDEDESEDIKSKDNFNPIPFAFL